MFEQNTVKKILVADMTKLPGLLINSLFGLVRSLIFQLAIKLTEIFERLYKSKLKVPTSAPRQETYHFTQGDQI